jgi:hypothetical protein
VIRIPSPQVVPFQDDGNTQRVNRTNATVLMNNPLQVWLPTSLCCFIVGPHEWQLYYPTVTRVVDEFTCPTRGTFAFLTIDYFKVSTAISTQWIVAISPEFLIRSCYLIVV